MSTCAQNQSNQDEDGGSEQAESGHDAVQHFLSTSGSTNAGSRTNGLGSQPSRSMQQVITTSFFIN